MVVDGVRTNKKQIVRMHMLQSRFFNEPVMSSNKLQRTSAHELYRINKAQFDMQSMGRRRAFVQYIRTPHSTWVSRMRYRLQRIRRKLRGLMRVSK